MPIKTVIFDLGDVLMPLNKEKMYAEFESLGVINVKELFETKEFQDLYVKLEQNLDTALFRTRLRELFHLSPKITDQQIDKSWSAMLEDIPKVRLQYIQSLRQQGYKVLLLSNSNEIHHTDIQRRYGVIFGQLFNTQYYSHIVKLAKPDAEVYKYVTAKEEIMAEETLLLDDKPTNGDGARSAGLWAAQFTVHQSMKGIDLILSSINKRMSPQDKHHIPLSVFRAPAQVPEVALGNRVDGAPLLQSKL